MEVLASPVVGLEISCPTVGQGGLVRWTKIGRTAKEPRNVLRQHIQRFAGGVPTGNAFRVCWKNRKVTVPSRRKLAPLHQFNLKREVWILGAVRFELLRPFLSALRDTR